MPVRFSLPAPHEVRHVFRRKGFERSRVIGEERSGQIGFAFLEFHDPLLNSIPGDKAKAKHRIQLPDAVAAV
jgi:hypothetical protein